MERKLCGMLIRAVAFWAAFSVRAGEPELSGYSGFCDGDIVKDAVVDFSGLSLRGDAGLYYNAVDSLTHETLRGAAGIRRDFVTDPSGLRLTKMEAHGRYLRFDEPVPVTSDMSRDITDMEYNALNLPCRATFADGSHINWLYTASGEKLRQTVIATSGDTISRRDYLGPYLFVNNEFDRYETAEGYITPDDAFHAYIPDYQGNIVGVYNTAPDAITHVDSPLDQHTRYYPYGLPFADAYTPTANRRKYGAKELTPDLGLNAYDFEARTLVPAFPAFAQIDRLASLAHDLTPYRYGLNNPVNFIDPDGLFETEDEARDVASKVNNAPVQRDKNTGEWYICLNEQGNGPYVSGNVLYRYYGDRRLSWNSYYYIGVSWLEYAKTTQYNKNLNIWRGKNFKIYYGLSGKGPNQYTGSRNVAKTKSTNLGYVSKALTGIGIYTTYREYKKLSNQKLGPNMRRYLRDKHIRDQIFNGLSFGNIYKSAASLGYNLGYLIEDIGQWMTKNPNFRIRINPYTGDFTPIEKTLQEYDELGIPLY